MKVTNKIKLNIAYIRNWFTNVVSPTAIAAYQKLIDLIGLKLPACCIRIYPFFIFHFQRAQGIQRKNNNNATQGPRAIARNENK